MAVIENDPSIEAATRTVGEVEIRTAYRTCPLCEATCGLEITLKSDGVGGETVQRIRGDKDDVFSKGFICPKGSTLKHLHEDPDRLRVPMAKRDGVHVEVTWEEAWSEIEAGLGGVIERHGRSSLGVYGGNAGAHSLSSMMYLRTLLSGPGDSQPVQRLNGRSDATPRRSRPHLWVAGGGTGTRPGSH